MADGGHISLDDKYSLSPGRAVVNGREALVRLLLVQRAAACEVLARLEAPPLARPPVTEARAPVRAVAAHRPGRIFRAANRG